MPLIDVAGVFSREDKDKEKQIELQAEAKNQDLASNGGYLTFVKYALFSMLGALNFRLFFGAIPGLWGTFVGLMAIMSEGFAIYCWNKQHKSAGNHRLALQIFSVGFTVVSLAHGAASVYDLVNGKFALGPSIDAYIFWYSHVVAFPLIFSLMILAIFVLGFTHWSSKIAKERAKSQVEIAESRADLDTRMAKLEHQTVLAKKELEYQQVKNQTEMELTDLLASTVATESRKMEILRNVPDKSVRQRLATAFGIPDIMDSPASASANTENKEDFRYLTPKPKAQSQPINQGNFFIPSDEQSK